MARTITEEKEAYIREGAEFIGYMGRDLLAELDAERAVSKALAEALKDIDEMWRGDVNGPDDPRAMHFSDRMLKFWRNALNALALYRESKR